MKKILVTIDNNYIIIRYAIKMLRIFLLHAFFSSLYQSYLWILHGRTRTNATVTTNMGKREKVPHTHSGTYP